MSKLLRSLNRVWLRVYEYNTRGPRAYEKVGFRKEGVLRQENFREGRYWDTIIMGLLRAEWDNDPRKQADGFPEGESKP